MTIDLISTDPLGATQLIYAAKTQGLEFDAVWIVGRDPADCRILQDYAAIGGFILHCVASHDAPAVAEAWRARKVDLVLQIGSVLIRRALREVPRIGILNLHSGLLPRYRGLESGTWAALETREHGVTAHLIAAGVDTGPIVWSEVVPWREGETLRQLLARTHNSHKWQVFVRAAIGLRDGTLAPIEQLPAAGRQYFAPHPRLTALAEAWLTRRRA